MVDQHDKQQNPDGPVPQPPPAAQPSAETSEPRHEPETPASAQTTSAPPAAARPPAETGLDMRPAVEGAPMNEEKDAKPDPVEPPPNPVESKDAAKPDPVAPPAAKADPVAPPAAKADPVVPPAAKADPVAPPAAKPDPVAPPAAEKPGLTMPGQPPKTPEDSAISMAQPKSGTRPLPKPEEIILPQTTEPEASPSASSAASNSASAPEGKEAAKPRPVFEECPHCGYHNRVGTLICDNCKRAIVKTAVEGVSTKPFNEGESAAREAAAAADSSASSPQNRPISVTDLIAAVKSAGTDVFDPDMVLRFEIEGSPQPIIFYPKPETHIGRRDPMTGVTPEIDLTAFAGYRMGVSRDHCVLRLKDKRLELTDLGSSNGTSLNGMKLQPHAVHILRDGDELMLGKMVVRVIFQKRKTN